MEGQKTSSFAPAPHLPRSYLGHQVPSLTIRVLAGVFVFGVLALALYHAPLYAAWGLALLGLGLPAFLLVWFYPEVGLIVVVFLAASLVPADALDLRLPFGGLELRDLALIGMLGVLVLKGLSHGSLAIPWWPVGAPLLVFLGLASVSTLYALLYHHVEPNWVFSDLRALIFYSVYFVAAWTGMYRLSLTAVVLGLLALADLVTAVVILQQFLGAEHPLLAAMSYSNWQLAEIGQAGEVGAFGMTRVMPPGVVLVYFALLLAFCLLAFAPRNRRLRAVYGLQIAFLGFGVLLTYTRTLWVSSALAVVIALIVLTKTRKVRLGRCAVAGVLVICLLFGVLTLVRATKPRDSALFAAFLDRLYSMFESGTTLVSDSAQWRVFETEQALRSMSESPLLGVGLGNAYREVTTFLGEAVGWRTGGRVAAGEISRFTRFIHNSYLYIAVKMGLPGLVSFLWFYAALLVNSGRLFRNLSEGHSRAVALAVFAGSVGLMPWSFLHQHFVQVESTAIVGLMAGLAAGLHHGVYAQDNPHQGAIAATVRPH